MCGFRPLGLGHLHPCPQDRTKLYFIEAQAVNSGQDVIDDALADGTAGNGCKLIMEAEVSVLQFPEELGYRSEIIQPCGAVGIVFRKNMEAGYDKVAEVGRSSRQTLLEISLDLQLVVYWVPCSDKPIGPGLSRTLSPI